jgi:hypothetical protein
MPPYQFINSFLAARYNEHPGSLPLFSYKVNDIEYNNLVEVLRVNSQYDRSLYPSALFVLYAAEWWRRNFDGHHWTWEGIFENISKDAWNEPVIREELCKVGFRFWGRSIFVSANGNQRFLGTIFREAGIPQGLLEKDHYIPELIERAFGYIQNITNKEISIDVIKSISGRYPLPASLKNEVFFELIFSFVSELSRLKVINNLGVQDQPVDFLNQNDPAWREGFPLRIDSDQAKQFMDNILRDIVYINPRTELVVARDYILDFNENWRIISFLKITSGTHTFDKFGLNQENFGGLPKKIEFRLSYEGGEDLLGYGYKVGDEKISIQGLDKYKLPDDIHLRDWNLVLASGTSGTSIVVNLPDTSGLDQEVPWVFRLRKDRWSFLKEGSAKLTDNQIKVLFPANFTLNPLPDGLNIISFNERQSLVETDRDLLIENEQEGQRFVFRLGQDRSDDELYFAIHSAENTRKIFYYPRLNKDVFIGVPKVFQCHQLSGWRRSVTNSLQFRYQYGADWIPLNGQNNVYGRIRIRYLGNEGEVMFSRMISVLPRDFQLSLSQAEGTINLNNCAGFSTISAADAEGNAIVCNHIGTTASLSTPHGIGRPGPIKIRLSTETVGSVTICVPFPSQIAYFIDSSGQPLQNAGAMDLLGLFGARLVLTNITGNTRRPTVTFTLVCNRVQGNKQVSEQFTLPGFSTEEIPLIRFMQQFDHLLSFTNSLDARIRVEIDNLYFYLIKYSVVLQKVLVVGQLFLGLTVAEDDPNNDLKISAFPLNERFEKNRIISLDRGEHGWFFPENAGNTKWIYFPAKDSGKNFRPGVATLPFDDYTDESGHPINSIHEAVNFSFNDRQEALRSHFEAISCDFSHPDWASLLDLYAATDHVTMNAFDVWLALASSSRGLVRFFFIADQLFIEELVRSFSVNILFIKVSDWIEVTLAYQEYLVHCGLGNELVKSVVVNKVKLLEGMFKLSSLASILKRMVFNMELPLDFSYVHQIGSFKSFVDDEINGFHGYTGLIGRHTGNWPALNGINLNQLINELPSQLRQLGEQHYTKPVIYLPLLCAIDSIRCDRPPVIYPHKDQIKPLIDFDPEYFYNVFSAFQAYLWLNIN